jgi:hypothetical protein
VEGPVVLNVLVNSPPPGCGAFAACGGALAAPCKGGGGGTLKMRVNSPPPRGSAGTGFGGGVACKGGKAGSGFAAGVDAGNNVVDSPPCGFGAGGGEGGAWVTADGWV